MLIFLNPKWSSFFRSFKTNSPEVTQAAIEVAKAKPLCPINRMNIRLSRTFTMTLKKPFFMGVFVSSNAKKTFSSKSLKAMGISPKV